MRANRGAEVFAALGDETRLQLVARLCDQGPQSLSQLTSVAPLTRQAIAKHLRVMEGAGLVRSHREGRERIWELETGRLQIAREYLETVSSRWDDALDRLRRLVEAD